MKVTPSENHWLTDDVLVLFLTPFSVLKPTCFVSSLVCSFFYFPPLVTLQHHVIFWINFSLIFVTLRSPISILVPPPPPPSELEFGCDGTLVYVTTPQSCSLFVVCTHARATASLACWHVTRKSGNACCAGFLCVLFSFNLL